MTYDEAVFVFFVVVVFYLVTNLLILVSNLCFSLLFHKISAISVRKATTIPIPRTTYTPSMLIKPIRFRDNAVQREGETVNINCVTLSLSVH